MTDTPTSTRLWRVPLLAGFVAVLMAVGSGAGWAYWTAQASGSGTIATEAVAVSHANFANPASTTYLPSSLASTRWFTVTNGSAISGTANVAIASAETYASGLPISVWQVASALACTASTVVPASGVTTGSWASLSLTSTLAAGATATYCARTQISDWRTLADPAGGQTVNPVLSVTLSAQGWVATTPNASQVQRTAGMYPPVTGGFFDAGLSSWHTVRSVGSGLCLDVSASGGAGTQVISWNCHQDGNQRWQFIPVNGTDQSLVTIRPGNAPTTRVSASTAGALTIAAASTSPTQRWYVQKSSGSSPFFQLVSAATGKCLPVGGTSEDVGLSVVDCDSAQARLNYVREPLTLTSGSTVTLGFGWSAGSALVLQRLNGGTWSDVATVAAGSSSVAFARNAMANNADNTYRIVFSGTTDIAYGNIVLNRAGNAVTAVAGIG